MKYIFVAGAPGSKWSSVVKNIYWSPSIDHTDYTEERTYYHDASGENQLMHLGAYWDPGMEFGEHFDHMDLHSREDCEAEFDRPFTGEGIRIVKSHSFCYHIDYLKETWPDCPVVLVHRDNDACLGWWVRCGHFNITYPDYTWYRDLRYMASEINSQNYALRHYWHNNKKKLPVTNKHLAIQLGIKPPPDEYHQNYEVNDIRVAIV